MIIKRKKETRVSTSPDGNFKKVETRENVKKEIKKVGKGYQNVMKDSIHGLFDFK